MGLSEVQVLDSYENDTYADGQAAAIYGQYPPLVNACLPPGEWQSYDILFHRPHFHEDGTVARPARITVHHNAILVQDNVELWGPTTWLQNRPYERHPDKLPISLQDHGNPVHYRNIWLRELRESEEQGPPAGPDVKVVDLPSKRLQEFVGAYGSILGDFGTIELKGQQLQLHMKMGQVIDLVPRSTTEFALRLTAAKLVFDVTDQDNVLGFTMHVGGEKYPIKPATSSVIPGSSRCASIRNGSCPMRVGHRRRVENPSAREVANTDRPGLAGITSALGYNGLSWRLL